MSAGITERRTAAEAESLVPPAPEVPGAPEVRGLRPGLRTYLRVKRLLDALAAGTALVLLSPLLLVVWVLVLVMLGRPALFVQERVTLGGRRFPLRKFRTMRPEDPARGWVSEESRLTAFGRGLRASSLDELPSLWNILVGDMSLIGPRPLPSRYLPLYSPEQSGRHRVRAGLTGLAQVSGRNGVPWDERLELDQRYVLLCGPLLDLWIFLRTFATVLSRDGVTEAGHATSTDYPGPMHTPRLRLVPRHAAEAAAVLPAPGAEWTALTPEEEPVARCGLMVLGDAPARVLLEPSANLRTLGGEQRSALLAEALALVLSRARAAGCETAELRFAARTSDSQGCGPADPAQDELEAVLLRAGFRREAGTPGDSTEGALFTAAIGCSDTPLHDTPRPDTSRPDSPRTRTEPSHEHPHC
ncbi:sugar transferase [Brevibacterium album]|uniref:sugar transferase n=1 Tax=Brevibacterium album TaxID=417948 RepID=UPI00041ECA1A|nr:sugar transferase [Brevibacterium album]